MMNDVEMVLLDFEEPLRPLYKKWASSQGKNRIEVEKDIEQKLKKLYGSLTHWQRTQVARHPNRPYAENYIRNIFDDVYLLSGDRLGHDDKCTLGAIGFLGGRSVVIVGQQKGRNLEDNIRYNFGMPQPEGYRKALRLFKLADRFRKPIVTFVDTPGAYPGLEGEERSQSEAIARCLMEMGSLRVPVIAVVIGEGGSGGALAIAVGNRILMMENAVYSVISPESCASILWKDSNLKEEAAHILKNDPKTALKFGIIDEIIPEGIGGAHRNWETVLTNVKKALIRHIDELSQMTDEERVADRRNRFFKMGVVEEKKSSPKENNKKNKK